MKQILNFPWTPQASISSYSVNITAAELAKLDEVSVGEYH